MFFSTPFSGSSARQRKFCAEAPMVHAPQCTQRLRARINEYWVHVRIQVAGLKETVRVSC
jgi:hypothetical protein